MAKNIKRQTTSDHVIPKCVCCAHFIRWLTSLSSKTSIDSLFKCFVSIREFNEKQLRLLVDCETELVCNGTFDRRA